MKQINGSTALYGLVGYPVSHSLSPRIHNMLFARYGINSCYVPLSVAPDLKSLASAMIGLQQMGFCGLNVTSPYKRDVLHLLDCRYARVDKLQAANTVWKDHKGRWCGDNTDLPGLMQAFQTQSIFPAKHTTLLLGAGGAAYAAAYAMLSLGCAKLTILNRTPESAKGLQHQLKKDFPQTKIQVVEWGPARVGFEDYTLILNALPITPSFLEESVFAPDVILYDLRYRAHAIDWLQKARLQGAKVHSGLQMLVEQAVLSFQRFTGYAADSTDVLHFLYKEKAAWDLCDF